MSSLSPLKSLNIYLLKYRWYFLFGILCVILSNVFSIYIPVFVRQGIDDALFISRISSIPNSNILYSGALMNAMGFGLAILIAAILKGVFMYFMRQLIVVNSRRIEFDQKNQLFRKYLKLDETFFRNNYTGDLMNRITEDISNVRMYLGPSIMYFANILFSFVLIVSQMWMVNHTLTMWVLIPLPFLSYSIYRVSQKINIGNKKIQEQLSIITTKAQETFAGIRVIKSFGAESSFNKDFYQSGLELRKKSLELAKINALFFPLMAFLMGISTVIVLYIGGLEVEKGLFTPGNVAEFIIYLNMLIWPVASLGWTTALVQKASASQKRINDFLSEEEVVNPGNKEFSFEKNVQLVNLNYQYQDKNHLALSNISLEIKKGMSYGIVGKTGSGKSTLIQILSRQLAVGDSTYLVDGIPVLDFQLSSFRSKIAYVQQDVFLFSASIKDNILVGASREVSDTELEEVLRLSALESDLKLFKDGIETIIGERGVSLSGGQKQRLSLARALLRDAEIYFLDDCLSAVDAETESRIIENLSSIQKNKTWIMSSHRVAPLLDSDEIWVLEEGTLTARGNHKFLIENNHFYQWLNENQQES